MVAEMKEGRPRSVFRGVDSNETDEVALKKKLQLYCTPPHIIRAFLTLETVNGSICEPCVGLGHIARELIGLPNTGPYDFYDAHDWGFPGTLVHRYQDLTGNWKWIITNPPHRDPGTFIRCAKQHADNLAVLLPLRAEHSVDWADIRSDPDYRLRAVLAFTQTVKVLDGPAPTANWTRYGWFIFKRGWQGEQRRQYITFGRDGEMILG